MSKGTDKQVPLNHILLMLYHIGHKLNNQPANVKLENKERK